MAEKTTKTTFLMIRHGHTEAFGKGISGRLPGIHLSEQGRRQAEELIHRLSVATIDAIYSSPLERARETALPLSNQRNIPVQISSALTEVGFGDWTGLSFEQLRNQSGWSRFNRFRSSSAPPRGELMLDVQARAVREVEQLRNRHPNQSVALFSHGDVIKLLIAHYLGIPHDLFHRIEISPASVSMLEVYEFDARILGVNDTAPL